MRLLDAARAGAVAPLALAREWLVLLRPRVAGMVFLATLVGALLAAGPGGDLLRCLEASVYVTLVTACASILNQVLERDTDARMERTRHRPLVTGALHPRDALIGGALAGVAGTAGLALAFDLLAALLALATLCAYVGVYTPMKRVSTINTAIGALPGAAPPLLGYVALAGGAGPWAWLLFGVLFAWQFPHFMAIAWLYRRDYARAGLRMLPALPGSEGVAGRQALVYALALVPFSLLPSVHGLAGIVYTSGALLAGLVYVAASFAFARREDAERARLLLRVSLAYLPLLFASILLDPVVVSSYERALLTLP